MEKIYALFVLAILSALVCVGCAETTPIYYSTPFDKAQADRMLRPGRNTVIVNGFTNSSDGGSIYTCAGEITMLMPSTERAAEFAKIFYGSAAGGQREGYEVNAIVGRIVNDPEFSTRYLSQRCDSDGFAVYKNVADGEFYVFASAGNYSYGGKVYVRGGETKKVILSGTAKHRPGFDYDHWYKNERRREWEASKRKQ